MRRALAPLVVLTVLVAPVPVAAAGAPAFRVPEPVVKTLPNGLRVAVFPNPRLPIVQMQLLVPAGSATESDERAGVANLTAQMLRHGTSSRTAAQFATDLERLGGNVQGTASREFSTVSGAFLAADFEAGLELLSDVVLHPIFPPAELERVRGQTVEALLQNRQASAAIADEYGWQSVLPGHPYARSVLGRLESVRAITREDVRDFHRDAYRPDRAVLAIAGDVTAERALAAVEERFGSWSGRAALPAIPAAPASPAPPRIRIVDSPGRSQSEIRVVLATPGRGSEDREKLQLLNQILGGPGVTSRLAGSVRVASGLSYDARSTLTLLRNTGVMSLSTFARNDSVAHAVRRMRAELERLRDRPPTADEVEAARRYALHVFPLQFESLGAIVAHWMAADLYGTPLDPRERLRTLSVEDVASVARSLDPARAWIVVVGPASELRTQLEPLGAVEVVTLPAMTAQGTAVPSPTADEQKRGRETLERAIAAHGGLAKLRSIHESLVEGEMSLIAAGSELRGNTQQARKDPWKYSTQTRFLAFTTREVLNGDRAWTVFQQSATTKVEEEDSLGVRALRAQFLSDVVHLLLEAREPGVTLAARRSETLDGARAEVVDVFRGGEVRRLWFDAATRRLVAAEADPAGDGRSFGSRRRFRDLRAVNGVWWPFHEERFLAGQRVMELRLSRVALNSGLEDVLFRAPAAPPPSPENH